MSLLVCENRFTYKLSDSTSVGLRYSAYWLYTTVPFSFSYLTEIQTPSQYSRMLHVHAQQRQPKILFGPVSEFAHAKCLNTVFVDAHLSLYI